MSRTRAFLGRLEDLSDWLSPIVVKEVRQVVRGREFTFSFAISLLAGLTVAFFGAANALTGTGTSGGWTFGTLLGCLTLLGLVVVPIGAFSALRNERMEQTLELITLTALSPRRVVIGKLLAQGVKLTTLFAGIAPFIAMSFLLGGIDFVTILVSLLVVFMWSLWACAACLFLSTLLKSRAMSGLVFGGASVVLFVLFLIVGLGRAVFFGGGHFVFLGMAGSAGSPTWWALAMVTTACLATMVNLVLLAENRLSLATENRVTPLRVGFLLQFLLLVAWTISFINKAPAGRLSAVEAMGVLGGLHLALVAMFTVTEDLVVPRRVLLQMAQPSPWRWLLTLVRPGGGRGAVYVLAQMAILLSAARLLNPGGVTLRWLLALCGYICFFTGVPAFAFRVLRPGRAAVLPLRVTVLALLPVSMLLPDLIYYVLWQPAVFDLDYSGRHLLNPLRTLGNWNLVETRHWFAVPLGWGLAGVLAYLGLFFIGARMTAQPAPIEPRISADPDREQPANSPLPETQLPT